MTTPPRPEYPRPRLVRDEWLCLNGEWEFAFGEAAPGSPLEGRITVPFAHQWAMSGMEDRRLAETVVYARGFEVPDAWREGLVLLHFGAVDYEATVWVNGVEVGAHRGGHVPFSFEVSAHLRRGENRVAVRAVDPQDPRQPRGKQASIGKPHGIDYWCTTGIWQTVWLEPVGASYLADLVVETEPSGGALLVRPVVYGGRADLRATVEAYDGDRLVARAEGGVLAGPSLRLEIPDAKPWSPESPFLYDLRARLTRGGETLDEARSYAGLRTVELRDGRFALNGRPTILKLVLDQGYWPESGLTAPSDEALRADVEACLAMGFNGARKHQKVEDPRWLYWCDRLGLMAWGEMANARAWSHEGQRALEAEWASAVERDRSHPCVVAWVPLNESMGFPDLEAGDALQRAGLASLVHLTRRLDPSRPVIDNDGWEQTDAADVVAVHDYSRSGAELAARYADGGLPARIWSGSRATFLHGAAAGRPILLTEVGGFLTRPSGVEKLDVMYSVYESIGSDDELLERVEELLEGIASVPFLAGFCYTQLTDVEQERNGLLTYDRRAKVDPARMSASLARLTDRLLSAGLLKA